MQQNKFLVALIALLLVLNLGTLGYLFFTSHPPPPPRHEQGGPGGQEGRPGSISMRLKEPLSLSDAQAAAIDSMHNQHLALMDSTDRNFHDAMKNYFFLLTKESYTPLEKDSLLNIISELNARKALLAFNHFEDINKLLNPGQQKKFKEMLPDILRRVVEGGSGPHPHH